MRRHALVSLFFFFGLTHLIFGSRQSKSYKFKLTNTSRYKKALSVHQLRLKKMSSQHKKTTLLSWSWTTTVFSEGGNRHWYGDAINFLSVKVDGWCNHLTLRNHLYADAMGTVIWRKYWLVFALLCWLKHDISYPWEIFEWILLLQNCNLTKSFARVANKSLSTHQNKNLLQYSWILFPVADKKKFSKSISP